MRGKRQRIVTGQRLGAAHDHIDHLTDQLAEAKIRARRVEADAARLPSVEAELRRLRAQQEKFTSDQLDAVEARWQKRLDVSETHLLAMASVVKDILDRHDKCDHDPVCTVADFGRMQDALREHGGVYLVFGGSLDRPTNDDFMSGREYVARVMRASLAESGVDPSRRLIHPSEIARMNAAFLAERAAERAAATAQEQRGESPPAEGCD